MCGIAGYSNFNIDFQEASLQWIQILNNMNKVQKHRGPDEDGISLDRHCGLGHVRLSIIDLLSGQQPMKKQIGEKKAVISYNGEIYNMKALKEELRLEGITFETTCDTEVILAGYMVYGCDFVQKLNGIFAFAIWDEKEQKLFLFRDHAGIKPLFYTLHGGSMVFSSEIKGLFCFPGVMPCIDREGLCEIFGLGPAKTYGKGVFKDVMEVLPGHFLEFQDGKVKEHCYWSLKSQPHEDTMEETIEKTHYLVTDAIKLQMLSDVPICTFLSGGVDSSFVTAICSEELRKQGKILDTYSFDFTDNHINFKANDFQPTQDKPWVDKMKEFSKTNHHYLECGNKEQYEYLFDTVDARDLPCMADVESSMLYFCKKVAENNKVALTGECADEIFGGYPWFHKKECFDANIFPWSMDMKSRTMLLRDEILQVIPLEEYARSAYEKTVKETPSLYGESKEEKRRREISYLNIKWFMQTLLDRCDRTSMHTGLEARVPMADYRIMEYLWNVPWEMKCYNGIVKGLLRKAGENHLPEDVLYRRKSPYPKTYDPAYENLLKMEIKKVIQSTTEPLCELIDPRKLEEYLKSPSDYGRPFYGQLMAGPQLLAYLLQVNYWLKTYHIQIKIG